VTYEKKPGCTSATAIYDIRIEAFIKSNDGTDFRRLSNITSVRIVLTNNGYCWQKRIYPPPPLWGKSRNDLVQYIDVKGIKTPKTMNIYHNTFHADDGWCGFS